MLPSEHFVDSAYVSAERLVNAQKQQIELMGPTRKNASWQSKLEDGYDESRFDIDWSTETVTCPEGNVSKSWNPRVKLGNRAYVQVRFSSLDCSICNAKERCTCSPQRSLNFSTASALRSVRTS